MAARRRSKHAEDRRDRWLLRYFFFFGAIILLIVDLFTPDTEVPSVIPVGLLLAAAGVKPKEILEKLLK